MKKTVKINGVDTVIEFNKTNHIRLTETTKEYTGTHDFAINGVTYKVNYKTSLNPLGRNNVKYFYNGVEFKDNDKQVIEYILNN